MATPWGNAPVEIEVRKRIRAAVAAYAYEIMDTPIMGDQSFDKLVQSINPKMGTCHPLLDEFFASKFSPMTGMWIHEHPQLERIKSIYHRYYSGAVKEMFEAGRRRGKALP